MYSNEVSILIDGLHNSRLGAKLALNSFIILSLDISATPFERICELTKD